MYHRPVCGAERKYEKPDIEVYWFLRDEDADVGGKTQRTAWQRDHLYPDGLMTRSMRLFDGEFKQRRRKILDAHWSLRWIPIPALRRHGGQPTSHVVTRQNNKPKTKQKQKEKKRTWTPSISCRARRTPDIMRVGRQESKSQQLQRADILMSQISISAQMFKSYR